MASVTFENGNKTIQATITSERLWERGDMARKYLELTFTGKRSPIGSLYEIISGSTKDKTIQVGDRQFAYEYGIDAGSKTKRAEIDNAIMSLLKNYAA